MWPPGASAGVVYGDEHAANAVPSLHCASAAVNVNVGVGSSVTSGGPSVIVAASRTVKPARRGVDVFAAVDRAHVHVCGPGQAGGAYGVEQAVKAPPSRLHS